MPKRRKGNQGNLTGKKKANEVRARRENETSVERNARLTQTVAYQRTTRANESEEQRAERLARNAAYASTTRENESEEQRAERLAQMADHVSTTRANESDVQRAERLAQMTDHASTSRANESDEQRAERLAQMADHASTTRANESDSEHAARISREADRYRSYLATESPRERARRLATAESNTDSANNIARPRCSRRLFSEPQVPAAVSIQPNKRGVFVHAGRQTVDNIIESENPEFYCGAFNVKCVSCGSKNFAAETSSKGLFSSCCHKGKIKLKPIRTHERIVSLMKGTDGNSKNFIENIRSYNSALAFASMGAQIKPPPGYGPYCFRIHGQIYHRTSPLHPRTGENAQFAQMYILDAQEALSERMGIPANADCLPDVMNELGQLMHDINPFAEAWKMMRDVELEEEANAQNEGREYSPVTMSIVNDSTNDQRRYNAPRCNEVAIIFQNAMGEPPFHRDISIHSKSEFRTQNISFLHKKCDALSYPLLFPYGDSGWKINLSVREALSPEHQVSGNMEYFDPVYDSEPERDVLWSEKISQLQYYSYRLAVRDEFNPLLNAGKLTQQYIVDSYVKIESNRLNYIRLNQKALRAESYKGLTDHIANLATSEGAVAGTPVILPSSFQGSPRCMQQNYQDAMAIVRKTGRMDVFTTITFNPRCQEVTENLEPWQKAEHRPDLVARVFQLKLKELLRDFKDRHIFGKVVAQVHVIEFQKRGLPHAHILHTLASEDKLKDSDAIDELICAEIPDPETHPILHDIVIRNMIHGPCGPNHPNAICMVDGKCSKGFPKPFQNNTLTEINGYPIYKRRMGPEYKIGNRVIDNSWVVPYNPYLLLKYNCHINVEACASIKSVKYLFKYVYKGHDCANIKMNVLNWNEPDQFMDSRYISAPEAMWRIREYKMHEQSHSIIRLAVHLEKMQTLYFEDGEENIALMLGAINNTTLTAWFKLNQQDEGAHEYLYPEIPEHYVYIKKDTGYWKLRQRGGNTVIGRMYSVSAADGERFYLRLLLLHVRGATSFTNLRTVNGIVCPTYKDAAIQLNLLADDSEWENSLSDAAVFQMPYQLRELLAMICVFGNPQSPMKLWEDHKHDLTEDFLRENDSATADNLALIHIQSFFEVHRKTCRDFGLPEPTIQHVVPENDLADLELLQEQAQELVEMLNPDQQIAFDAIMQQDTHSTSYFVDGPGGSGKTFLYNALIKSVKAAGQSVLCVASTGIAATLLEDGTTYHSQFGLGGNATETTTSCIRVNSVAGRTIRDAKMIIWDEVTMTPYFALDAVDRLLREIMQIPRPFGNKVVLIGGDFRQILPVVRHGNRAAIVQSSIKQSKTWKGFKSFKLTKNMRTDPDELEYAEWLIQLGNGDLTNEYGLGEGIIEIPPECVETGDLVKTIFGTQIKLDQIKEFTSRAILTPKNENVHEMNNEILNILEGECKTYYSIDTLVDADAEDEANYPVEFLNSLNISGLPLHELKLKVGAMAMLMRNLNKKRGLCNGTRILIKSLKQNVIHAEVLTGKAKGQEILIPRCDLTPSESSNDLPFTLKRRQFPIMLAFAMSINKSQGQSFHHVGIFLPAPVFSHGQLYVAFSRGKNKRNVKVKVLDTQKQGKLLPDSPKVFTYNCVYKEIFA